jgi:hypothetical protein
MSLGRIGEELGELGDRKSDIITRTTVDAEMIEGSRGVLAGRHDVMVKHSLEVAELVDRD